MGYRFTGFFAQPRVDQPAKLPTGVVWREISAPFTGVGISLPERTGKRPGPDEVQRLLAEVGLGDTINWLFIDYATWAGPIDCVYGLGSSAGRAFGPVDESARDAVEPAYLELMRAFGLTPADALNFPPFVRGFWGE